MDSLIHRIAARYFAEMGSASGASSIQGLAGDGSPRLFYRANPEGSGKSVVIMHNPPVTEGARRENLAYLMIGRHLFSKAIPVPEIHRWDLIQGWFLMEDLGLQSLQDVVFKGRDPLSVYGRVLETLLRLQTEGAKGFDPSWCWQTERYDLHVMRRLEADYFRDLFLSRFLGLKTDWPELERPFNSLAAAASRAGTDFLMHRDFQSRNIMVSGETLGFVDWQGARLGPLGYDLASLLIDPYTQMPGSRQSRLYEVYMDLVRDRVPERVAPLEDSFPYLAIQRNLQILGAFSFLSRIRGKIRFEAYIPAALETLVERLRDLCDPLLGPLEETVLLARDRLNRSVAETNLE